MRCSRHRPISSASSCCRNSKNPAVSASRAAAGPALDLPRPVLDVSPFGHLPALPGGAMAWTPVAVLTVIAAALVAAGLTGLRRRDLGS